MRGFAHQHDAGGTAPVRRRIRAIVNEYGRRVAVFLTLSQQHGRRDGGVSVRHEPQTVGEDERQQRRGDESAGVPETLSGAPGQHEIEAAQEGRPVHWAVMATSSRVCRVMSIPAVQNPARTGATSVRGSRIMAEASRTVPAFTSVAALRRRKSSRRLITSRKRHNVMYNTATPLRSDAEIISGRECLLL